MVNLSSQVTKLQIIRKMGRTALGAALSDLRHAFLWLFFLPGKIFFDMGGLKRIAVKQS